MTDERDIVERLNAPHGYFGRLMRCQAATEIKALRAENARLYEWKDKAGDMDRVKTVELVDLRADNARLREALSETSNLLHELTAIIPGNDTAGAEVARVIRAARAAMGESDE